MRDIFLLDVNLGTIAATIKARTDCPVRDVEKYINTVIQQFKDDEMTIVSDDIIEYFKFMGYKLEIIQYHNEFYFI